MPGVNRLAEERGAVLAVPTLAAQAEAEWNTEANFQTATVEDMTACLGAATELEGWRQDDNHFRPHGSLGYLSHVEYVGRHQQSQTLIRE